MSNIPFAGIRDGIERETAALCRSGPAFSPLPMIVIPFAEILAPANFKKISDCLQADGVIAYPTDTLYGLGGNFYSPAAHARRSTS